MSFIPQIPADSTAVAGSLRVGLANNLHAGERLVHVALDTLGDIAHQSTICANAALLSAIQYHQSLLRARTCRDLWSAVSDHGLRLNEAYFKYVDQTFASRHRAVDRLTTEGSHVEK